MVESDNRFEDKPIDVSSLVSFHCISRMTRHRGYGSNLAGMSPLMEIDFDGRRWKYALKEEGLIRRLFLETMLDIRPFRMRSTHVISSRRSLEREPMERCIWPSTEKPENSRFAILPFPCRVAIKRIEDVFRSRVDAKRTLREITILRQCNHPNISKLLYVHLVDFIPAISSFLQIHTRSDVCGRSRSMEAGISRALSGTPRELRGGDRTTSSSSSISCSAVFCTCRARTSCTAT